MQLYRLNFFPPFPATNARASVLSENDISQTINQSDSQIERGEKDEKPTTSWRT